MYRRQGRESVSGYREPNCLSLHDWSRIANWIAVYNNIVESWEENMAG